MPDLPQQQTYKSPTETAFALGKSLPSRGAPKRRESLPNIPMQQAAPGRGATPGPAQEGSPLALLQGLGTQTTKFGGSTRYEPGGTHQGEDWAGPSQDLPALMGGKIVESGTAPGFGNTMVIQTPSGDFMRYSHLSQRFLPVDTEVARGDIFARTGQSGSVYSRYPGGDPTHLDIRIYNKAKEFFSPTEYLSNI